MCELEEIADGERAAASVLRPELCCLLVEVTLSFLASLPVLEPAGFQIDILRTSVM